MSLNIEATLLKKTSGIENLHINVAVRDDARHPEDNDSLLEIHNFNTSLIAENPWLEDYLYIEDISSAFYKKKLIDLLSIDQGGFEHGDLSGLYVAFQNSPRYNTTRLCGWNNLLQIAFSSMNEKSSLEKGVILDFLAGSGTLSKKVKQLSVDKFPTVIGIDVSRRMAKQAQLYNELVFWADCKTHPFKSNIADVSIAAYGFHHVPFDQRGLFVANMKKPLKKNGVCIIHDFEEGSATARWYSEIIHSYRTVGHPYPHVTPVQLENLLTPHFNNVNTCYLYDPFYLEGIENQDIHSLKREFYAYLIGLFNLEKLLPKDVKMNDLSDYKNLSYWEDIDKLFFPYFSLSADELKNIESSSSINKVNVPLVANLTVIQSSTNKLCLIAPRVALVGVGC